MAGRTAFQLIAMTGLFRNQQVASSILAGGSSPLNQLAIRFLGFVPREPLGEPHLFQSRALRFLGPVLVDVLDQSHVAMADDLGDLFVRHSLRTEQRNSFCYESIRERNG
jgi:hypothetical protein